MSSKKPQIFIHRDKVWVYEYAYVISTGDFIIKSGDFVAYAVYEDRLVESLKLEIDKALGVLDYIYLGK